MASAKALAAIALTLIIAVPICLGYGLASHDVPYNDWTTSNTINLSDQLLNSTTPYTMENMGPANNSELLQRWTFPGAGVTEYHRIAPDYRLVSSNYSSIPEYTTSDTEITMTAATSNSYELTYSGNIVSVGTSESNPTYSIIHRDLYYIGVDTTGPMPLHWAFTTDRGSISLTSSTISVVRDSSNTWTAIVNDNTTVTGASWWRVDTDYHGTVNIASRNYTSLSPGTNYSFSTAPSAITGIQLYSSSTSTAYYTYTTTQKIVSFNGGDVQVGETAYSGITSVSVVYPAGTGFITVTVPTPTGNYADPSEGWTVPMPSNPYWTWWTNGHQNTSVDMMIKFTGNATVYMSPTQGTTQEQGTYTVKYTSGTVSINNQALGSYTAIEAIFTETGATFYGISEWPNMTQTPIRLNYLEFTEDVGLFTSIELYGSEFNNISFRVDKAKIVAGSFPSTKDYTLNMSGLFPNKSYNLKLNSIGIYGDTITIAGESFTVTNDRITVNGETIPLKGAIISSRLDGASYAAAINGHTIGTTPAPASVTFGGEWSLTVTANTLTETNGTRAEWAPGGFAFEKDDFIGAVVLVAVLAFIGVGIYGARSGVKVGLLLMVCGGVALAAMSII